LCWTAVAWADPTPGPEPTFKPPTAVRSKLSNGLTLLVVENPRQPIVTLRLVVPGAGSAADPRGKAGLAAFTADLLDEGSGARSAIQVSEEVESLGATLSTGADDDAAVVQMTGLARTWNESLALFAEVVAQPRFDATEATRVHGDRKTALLLRKDRPREISALRLAAALYGAETPHGHATDGNPGDFDKVTLADAVAFYGSAWDPSASALVVVGAVSAKQVAADVEARLGGWKAKGGKRLPPMVGGKPSTKRLLFVERKGAEQSDVTFGMLTLPREDAGSYALEVLVNAWGGGFTGRLTQVLREKKGYLYHVYPDLLFHPRGGVYTVLAPLVTPSTAEGMKEVLLMIGDMRKNGLPSAELAKAKLNLTRDLPDRFETSATTAAAFGDLFRLGLPDDWYVSYAAKITAVTADDVKRAAQKELARVTFVVVGDPSVRAAVEKLGLGKAEVWDLDGKRR
jgi:zinc protease